VIELLTPMAFLEGVKLIGLSDLSQVEAACVLRVLSKPELENAVILNELVLIMENFGVVETYDDDEESEDEEEEEQQTPSKAEVEGEPAEKRGKGDMGQIDEKGRKILVKLARFLLQRYMHPREFFGPAIYKQTVATSKGEKQKDVM
jgi:hypothetical protein